MKHGLMSVLCAVLLVSLSTSSWSQGRAGGTPVPRDCAAPVWPLEALRYELEGSTVLEFDLDEADRATAVKVKRSSGWKLLDDESVRAVKSCTFVPATKEGMQRRAILQAYQWKLAPQAGPPRAAPVLLPASCAASERFATFVPSPPDVTKVSGVLVRFLVNFKGEPFGIKFEGGQDLATVEAANEFIKSCRFKSATRNGQPVPGQLYGHIGLKST